MSGNRRDSPREGDQPDWDSCIAWRRMLTAVVNVGWDFQPAVVEVRDWLAANLHRIDDDLHRDDILFYIEETDAYLKKDHPYGSCYYVLEGLARFRQISGPDRIEVVGQELCVLFQRIYPTAPSGFERTGRMRQKPGGEQAAAWVEPLREFFHPQHRVHLRGDHPDL
jgi:hypothetical protein